MTPFLTSFCNFMDFFQVFEFDSCFLHKFFEIVDRIRDEKSVAVQFGQSFLVSLIDERGGISLKMVRIRTLMNSLTSLGMSEVDTV